MIVTVYTIAIFLSATLLFLVQPMFARMALPLLGGSPYVWNTALVFYQAVLLAGYAYAHFATRWLGVRRQAILHIVILILPLFVLPIAMSSKNPPVEGSPIPWLLMTMLVSVGLPFFVISSSGPLLQRWFASVGHADSHDPYFLYVASNLGSMMALFIYPSYVEPNYRLLEQSQYWAVGYAVYAVLMAALGIALWKTGKDQPAVVPEEAGSAEEPRLQPATFRRKLRWIALALIPTSLMVGTTTFLTTDIASVPLLWVFPLATYLFSFIMVFAARPPIPHRWMTFLLPYLLVGTLVVFVIPITFPAFPIGALSMLTLFVGSMVFHGELARDRPSTKQITEFFLLISVGGVLGGIFSVIIAPLLFVLVIEYPLTLVLGAMLLPGRVAEGRKAAIATVALAVGAGLITWGMAKWIQSTDINPGYTYDVLVFGPAALLCLFMQRVPVRFGLCCAGVLVAGVIDQDWVTHTLYTERSFYGTLRVSNSNNNEFRRLRHGTTNHGVQNLVEEARLIPTSYYHPTGPIGEFFNLRGYPPKAHIGVVGLGAGTLAMYGKPDQDWTFYEIDPEVVKVAEDPKFFTFLENAPAPYKVILGDARLALTRNEEKYDVLVLDAYSSDAVPVHLLTKEAIDIYFSHLNRNGVLALHLSNRNIELEPVVAALAKELGKACIIKADFEVTDIERNFGKSISVWALMADDPGDFGALQKQTGWVKPNVRRDVKVWTDDFSNVFSVMRMYWR